MALTISSSFDAGNIRVVRQSGDSVDLEIAKDQMSDFYQWFYFRISGAAGRKVTLRITNCAGSAYPHGWPDYKGVMSLDRDEWIRIQDTTYADGVLTMKLTPPQDLVWIAYFAPYSMERHHDLVTQTGALEGVGYHSLGKSSRRPGPRLPDGRRWAAQRVAVRAPAPRREHGRMVDGGGARKADGR